MNFSFNMPVRFYAGEGCVAREGAALAALGTRCLIVTGHTSAKKCGALDDVTAVLDKAGIPWRLFDKVSQNPLLSTCKEAGQEAMAFGADFLVGIGGGSPLDATKAIAVFGANDIPALDIYKLAWEKPALPFALVGTTAGTGSEVTPFSVLTVDGSGRKKSVGHQQCYAAAAFGDPRYTASLGYQFTVSTALDALCHAIEGYFSTTSTDISDMFAIQGAKLLLGALEDVEGKEPAAITLDQRERLYYGSILAGITISASGTGFCHPMGYFLSEERGVPHGTACAVFLPDYIRRAVEQAPQKAAVFFRALGTTAEEVAAFIARINQYTPEKITDKVLEELLERWKGVKNFDHSPGGVPQEVRRAIAKKTLQ